MKLHAWCLLACAAFPGYVLLYGDFFSTFYLDVVLDKHEYRRNGQGRVPPIERVALKCEIASERLACVPMKTAN
jgi:hypothetical protein